ncbi:MAG: response regulator [Leptolyngbya sp. SIO4C1]|nr:response regulator [Leptolyngbya sp. SIO4C1]
MAMFNGYGLLLVEDDSNDILLIQRAFRRANLTIPISIVKDGDEAIDYLLGHGQYANRASHAMPSLILLDLKLPRRSGLEVLEWLRAQPVLRRIPVVVLTSSEESEDVNCAYEMGVNSYLVKPVTFDALIAMIEALNGYWLTVNQYPSLSQAAG